ncbi:hypothetical protein Btru_042741 [Bulinus truncatus]|nr:hypothetical protein Btru_042741 [Bulinus truncatus]
MSRTTDHYRPDHPSRSEKVRSGLGKSSAQGVNVEARGWVQHQSNGQRPDGQLKVSQTRKDLFVWFRLWGLCLVSGALAIQLVVYPAQTLDIYALGRAFVRGLIGLFLTEKDDLDGDPACSSLYSAPEIAYTCNAHVLSRLEKCPHDSWVNYVILIQYLLITRMVYYTLMFAIFGCEDWLTTTIDKTFERSIEIWKYQFYSLVTDFEDRSVVPVPFTLVTYPFLILNYGGKLCITGLFECASCLRGIQEQFKVSALRGNIWSGQ